MDFSRTFPPPMNNSFPFHGPAIPIIYLTLEPPPQSRSLTRPKTVYQLLACLDLPEESALVIRRGELLTPDRRIWPGDSITVRLAGSRG